MAIGLPLPPTVVPRSRQARRRIGTLLVRPTRAWRVRLLHVASATQAAWKRLMKSPHGKASPLRTSTRQRQSTQLADFEQHYESLVDLLCVAAREGNRPDRQQEYTRIRAWMRVNYPEFEPHIRSHWQTEDGAGTDPFIALFRRPDLEETVNADTGIEDIMRSRMALEEYRASLDAPGG